MPFEQEYASNAGTVPLTQRGETTRCLYWTFFLGGLMDQFIDWVYSQLVGFFGNFFAEMGNMGVEALSR